MNTAQNLFESALMLLDMARDYLPQIAWVGIPSALVLAVALPYLG